jgi:hypothetical protein
MSIAGHHTVAELREWLAAIDYQVGQVADTYAVFTPAWSTLDPSAYGDWSSDWDAFRARYARARDAAVRAIETARFVPIPDGAYPVDDEWNGVHRALRQSDGPAYAKGDFQDLYARIALARGAPIDMSQTPQPQATDVDLAVFDGAGNLVQAGRDAAGDLLQAGRDAWRAAPGPSTGTKILLGGGILLGLALVVRGTVR